MNPRPRHQPPAFPEALDGDDDDIAWALSTGGVEWRRGAHADALQWLRRAIDAARTHSRLNRARDLEFRGRTLQVALEVGWVSTPPSAPSPASPAVMPRIPGPPPAMNVRSAAQERAVPREDDAVELDADDLLDFEEDEDGLESAAQLESENEVQSEAAREDEDEDYADVRASEVEVEFELENSLNTLDEADVVLLPSDLPQAPSVTPPFPPPALEQSSAPPALPSAPRRPPSHPAPREAVRPPPERDLRELIDAPLLEFQESEPRPPQPTLVDEVPEPFPSDSPPPASLATEYFEPSSMIPPDPVDEEPTDRDVERTEIEHEPVPPPTPSASGLFPSVSPPDGPSALSELSLAEVAGLQDLPEDAQAALLERASFHELQGDEELNGFGLAIVLEGSVAVMPTVADVAVADVLPGQPVFGQGHLAEGVPLRVVARAHGARVAAWSARDLEDVFRECPWVGDELKSVGDRLQALAGVALGPLGESLDDGLRSMVVDRCEVRVFLENELVAEKGKALSGMLVIGAGHLEIVAGEAPNGPATDTLSSGDFLFPSQILQARPAPAHARAGKGGALGLFAPRAVAHELMVSVPPLLEIFAR